MIYGIGTDVISVARISRALARFGDRFAQRILAEREFADYRKRKLPERFLAKRFAAKEAFSKAMGTGIRTPVTWRYIEVGHDRRGKPLIVPHPLLAARMQEWSIGAAHISITDELDIAVAFVILERR
jgi:holo-[acyl-carrier protein] synthase